jgi:GLPGLI family protein
LHDSGVIADNLKHNAMKFYPLFFSLALLAGTFSSKTVGPEKSRLKPFEGTILYSIEYIKVPDEVKGMESMLPQEMLMSLSGDMVRVKQEVMGGSQMVLVDNKKKESHILMNMMGQKIDIFISSDEMTESEKEAPQMKVQELKGTKTILGYKCKEALLTNPDTGDKQTIFYTQKLEIKHKDFKSLNGFPLEYLTSQEGMTLRMVATKITEGSLPASHFQVPSGYERMTMGELNKMNGGN